MVVGPEAALDAMRQGRWQDARGAWEACLESPRFLTADDYNACARVYERLADWGVHQDIVHQGMLRFPHDELLQRRDLLGQAIDCLAREELDRAEGLLAAAGQMTPLSDWPCALGFWCAQVDLRQRLHGLSDRLERLNVISELALYRESHLMPYRVTGLLESIECMAWSETDKQYFAQGLESVVSAISSYDTALTDIEEDQELAEGVARFAHFCLGFRKGLVELTAGHCEFLARLFIGYGHVELYLYLRELFVQKIEALTHANKVLPMAYKLAQANERGDHQVYTRLNTLKDEMRWTPAGRKKMRQYFRLSSLCYAEENYSLPFHASDEDFYRYVVGKRVAIVGPVDVGLENGGEIDDFDIVVRFNYRQSAGYDVRKFGSKTHVSYYVSFLMRLAQPAPEVLGGMEELEYAVMGWYSFFECGWRKAIPCQARVGFGSFSYLSTPLVIGYPHAVQRSLIDLLRFKPAQIKVFSADLYTGMRYQTGYFHRLMLGLNGSNVLKTFTLHDPVSNFLFMQRLLQSGRIDVDDVLAKVLAMTVPEYMEQVRLCHVDSGAA